jgi:hypothetical protein
MITDGLDAFATQLHTATGMTVTADPGTVYPPCLFLDVPSITHYTMGAVTLAVPVIIVVPGPGDLAARDALLAAAPLVLDACGESTAEPRVFSANDLQYPAMTVTATLTITRST